SAVLRAGVRRRGRAVRRIGLSRNPHRTAGGKFNRFHDTARQSGSTGMPDTYDVLGVGGGQSGSTAATDLARQGYSVLLLDRAGRIKPCGGAIPPKLVEEFEIPASLLVARVTRGRM